MSRCSDLSWPQAQWSPAPPLSLSHQTSKDLVRFGMSSGCGQSIAAAQGTKSKLKASSSQHFRNSTLIIIPCLNQLKKLQTIWQEESHGISKIPQLSQISFQRRAAQVHQHHPRGNTFLGDLQTKGKVENPAQSHTMTPWASQEYNHQTTTA